MLNLKHCKPQSQFQRPIPQQKTVEVIHTMVYMGLVKLTQCILWGQLINDMTCDSLCIVVRILTDEAVHTLVSSLTIKLTN